MHEIFEADAIPAGWCGVKRKSISYRTGIHYSSKKKSIPPSAARRRDGNKKMVDSWKRVASSA